MHNMFTIYTTNKVDSIKMEMYLYVIERDRQKEKHDNGLDQKNFFRFFTYMKHSFASNII